MILQPIVENSVNYGIRDLERPGKITLSVYNLEGQVCVSIADNGVGIDPTKIDAIMAGEHHNEHHRAHSNGIGVNNCIKRLSLFYGRDDVMDIISEGKDKGTETILYLGPLEAED